MEKKKHKSNDREAAPHKHEYLLQREAWKMILLFLWTLCFQPLTLIKLEAK